jgi:phosphoglycerate dehydrogenase-like enzyme
MPKPKALYILWPNAREQLFGEVTRPIARLLDVCAPPQTKETVGKDASLLGQMEVLLTGWGGPKMDEAFLTAAPNLKAVFYAAGSIRPVTTEAFWDRNILITSAWDANAIPVAEYALSQIFWLLKKGWHFVFKIRRDRAYPERSFVPGAFGSTVGLISLGQVARHVCRLLRPFDLKVIAYDPFATPEAAKKLGVELVSLEEVFRRSDVVSLHTPWLKETEGLITGEHFRMMKEGAAFLNTARGAVVRENEMIEALKGRPDLWAVLDVTHPEPPAPGSPLYTLPNVVLTPHIAGPMHGECRRNARYMLSEIKRWLAGKPLEWAIDRKRAAVLA